MSEPTLFDATPFETGPGRALRRKPNSPQFETVGPGWAVLVLPGRPPQSVAHYVHLRELGRNADSTAMACRAYGRALDLPAGRQVERCPKCVNIVDTTVATTEGA